MKNILILGGDQRNKILFKLFENENFNVKGFGFYENDDNLENLIFDADIIVSATPLTVDNTYVYSMTKKNIDLKYCISLMKNKVFIAGKIDEDFVELLKRNNNKVVDLMHDYELATKNAIPTAEGVIGFLIEHTDFTINDSNIAVLGFGKIGSRIARAVSVLGANTSVYEINEDLVAIIEECGYNRLKDLNNDLKNMDVIINAVPAMVLSKEVLDNVNPNTVIVDVSSKPGGVDFEYAKLMNYKVYHLLGIPGKIAPRTAAEYIKKVVEKYID